MKLFSYLTYTIVIFFSLLFGRLLYISVEMDCIVVTIAEILFFLAYFLVVLILSINEYREKRKDLGLRLLLSIPISIGIVVLAFKISSKLMQDKYDVEKEKDEIFIIQDNLRDSVEIEIKIRAIEDSLNIDSRNKRLLVERGLLERQRGNYEKSIYFYDKAIIIDSMYQPAYYQAGYSAIGRFDYKRALKYYERAFKLDSSDSQIREKIIWLKDKISENNFGQK